MFGAGMLLLDFLIDSKCARLIQESTNVSIMFHSEGDEDGRFYVPIDNICTVCGTQCGGVKVDSLMRCP
jgi:hypothetical protein